MDSNQHDYNVYKLIALVLCVVVISITGSCQTTKYSITKMVTNGATPMQAACALNIAYNASAPLCAIEALKAPSTED